MLIKVELENIVNELELISDEGVSFLNRTTGALHHLSKGEIAYVDAGKKEDHGASDWQNENIRTAREIAKSDEYIQLPTGEEIDEHGIAEKFCLLFPDGQVREELLAAANTLGRGQRNFRDALVKYDIGANWYAFKREAFRKKAIDWCRKNDVVFSSDDDSILRHQLSS